MIYIYIVLSILAFVFLLKYSYRYGVFVTVKGFIIGIIYIALDLCYLGILNPKSKLHFLYDIFSLGKYHEFRQYIEYFTGFMALSLVIMMITFIFLWKPKLHPRG